MKDTINTKGFLGRLFCCHDYQRITEWKNIEIVEYVRALFQCKKCGKYKLFKFD